MKIILTETQVKKLVRLMESMSLEDYKTDLQKIIDSDQVFTKGMDSYKYNSGVAAVQSGLDKLGYTFNRFGIDGRFGNETLKNIEKFQEDNDLEVTGNISDVDAKKLLDLIVKKYNEKPEDIKEPEETEKSDNTEKKQIIKNSYIINLNNPTSKKITLIWGGMPSINYGAKFMEKVGKEYFKNKNVIYSNYENSILNIKKILEDNDLGDYKINSVSGFSRGGVNTWKEINGNYDFVGLIDPSTSKVYSNLTDNVKVVSNSGNWGYYKNIADNLRKMEKNGDAEKVSTSHLEIPKLFFEKYANQM
jgi:peptidoglycan hydrolase-like protein with peptidoglycan-binding domain